MEGLNPGVLLVCVWYMAGADAIEPHLDSTFNGLILVTYMPVSPCECFGYKTVLYPIIAHSSICNSSSKSDTIILPFAKSAASWAQ